MGKHSKEIFKWAEEDALVIYRDTVRKGGHGEEYKKNEQKAWAVYEETVKEAREIYDKAKQEDRDC